MKRRDFDKNKQTIFASLYSALDEGLKIAVAVEKIGLSYQSDYLRYTTKEERIQFTNFKKDRPRRRLDSPLRVKEPVPILSSEHVGEQVLMEQKRLARSFFDDVESRSDVSAEKSRVVLNQQVRLALESCVAILDQPEEYRTRVNQKLKELNDRGFVTKEQVGRFKFCLEGLRHTLTMIP